MDPPAPVHLLIGSGGAGSNGEWRAPPPAWSAWREINWGYSSLRFVNATFARFEFVAFNTSEVRHTFDVTRTAAPAVMQSEAAAQRALAAA